MHTKTGPDSEAQAVVQLINLETPQPIQFRCAVSVLPPVAPPNLKILNAAGWAFPPPAPGPIMPHGKSSRTQGIGLSSLDEPEGC